MRIRRCAPAEFRRALVVLLVVPLLLAGCGLGDQAVNQQAGSEQAFVAGDGTVTRYEPGDRKAAPRLQGELLDGDDFDLKKWRGDVVVINFWGQWCAPCRAEADDLLDVYNATKDTGVRFLGVNVRDSKDKARAFERNFDVTYPSLFDPAGRVALQFRETPPNAIPATIILDREGRVAVVFRKPLITTELEPDVVRLAAEAAGS